MNPVEMKILLKEVEQKLKEGISKKTLYDEYKEKIDRDVLEKYLASKPDPQLKSKYKILNYLLTFFLISDLLIIIFHTIFNSSKAFPNIFVLAIFAINGLFIYYIWKMNPGMYRLIFLYTAQKLYKNINIIDRFSDFSSFEMFYIASSLFMRIGIVFLSVFLAIKLFPYYGLLKPKMEDGKYIFTAE